MKTEILSEKELEKAQKALLSFEPIAFPTETVYGLGALVFQKEMIQKIFAIKKRPRDNPLIAHIADLKELSMLAETIPKDCYRLAEKFWPGPLTIVLPRSPRVPDIVSASLPSIAIRMPSHPIAKKLIELVSSPLVAPSANLSGRPSPTSVEDVMEDLEGKVPYIIDGGHCEVGIESTVVSLLSSSPILLRPGFIKKEEIEECLQKKVQEPLPNSAAFSPGMKYRHYAPKARLRLVFDEKELTHCFLVPNQKSLYHDLRDLDRKGIDEMDVYCSIATQKDEALMNRLLRAAGQIV